jgi:hypothetical protein
MAYIYKTVKVSGRTKLLHRHLMEQRLGRPLLRTEQVHHKNEDKQDNKIENLEVKSPAEHQRQHKQKHPYEKTCEVCGTHYVPHPTKRARSKTCSPECAQTLRWTNRRSIHAHDKAVRAKLCVRGVKV